MLCNCVNPHEDWGGRCQVCGLLTDKGFNDYVVGLYRSEARPEMGETGWRRALHEGPVTQWYWWHPNNGWIKDGPCATSEMVASEMYPVKLGDFDVTDEIVRKLWKSWREKRVDYAS
jgi:hypothetical protein